MCRFPYLRLMDDILLSLCSLKHKNYDFSGENDRLIMLVIIINF